MGQQESVQSEGPVDRVGIVASGLCAAHCAAGALIPGALGALGLGVFLGEGVEWAFTVVAIVVAALSVWLGFRRHRSARVAILLTAGMAGLLLSRLLEGDEHAHPGHGEVELLGPALAVVAGAVLIFGHVLSTRALRRCKAPCTDGAHAP